ncbi:DNA gyrase inhibitor YacG [Shewanella chilikensis]|uniref:DNA gyrase inhibitor YacG n=1 Tax=Shewanella chilikensis TaxID=558541 RepID=UPI001F3476C0|nr:DNA gyrase inhibitor YacG [Shewanella chilikensis]MCE9789091.1 DNA gyrase inhibitor YacG [Shewanella chilikensis]
MPITVKCPTCQKEVEWVPESKFKPFCSERCKLIDLGDWASEKHAIPVKPEFDQQMLDELGYDEGNFFKDQS